MAAVLLIAAIGCGDEDAKPTPPAAAVAAADGPSLVESPSIEFLPRGGVVPGWNLMGDPQVYPADQVRSYIGLEAGHYLQYDLVDLTVGEYMRPDGTGRATLEIYRFPDYVKAFGAFSTRNVPGKPLGLENASIVSDTSAIIWTGPFVVRIVSLGGPADGEPVRALAAAMTARMPKAPGRPAVFQFFPEQFRVPGSEKFVAGPVFGQPYLARGFVAEYQAGTEPIDGVILPAPSKEAATDVLNRYKLLFATNGRLLDPVPNLGEDNFVGEDRFLGRTAAYRIDRFVVAFRGFGDKQPLIDLAIASNQRILNSILQQLRAAEREALLAATARNRGTPATQQPAPPGSAPAGAPRPIEPAQQPAEVPPPTQPTTTAPPITTASPAPTTT